MGKWLSHENFRVIEELLLKARAEVALAQGLVHQVEEEGRFAHVSRQLRIADLPGVDERSNITFDRAFLVIFRCAFLAWFDFIIRIGILLVGLISLDGSHECI